MVARMWVCVAVAIAIMATSCDARTPLYSNNGTIPFGMSIAFAGETGTGFAITWSTLNQTKNNYVQYGAASGNYGPRVMAQDTVYYTSSYQHTAVVGQGLKPGTRYYYQVGNDDGVSAERSFTTARGDGDFTPFKIAVVGDMGITESKDTMKQMRALTDTEWVLHVGDISYADDHNSISPGSYEQTWNEWQAEMDDVTGKQGYMVCPGNHEASCYTTGSVGCPNELKNFTAFRNRFRMPSAESGGVSNMWYSFNYGMVHFVSLSSETDYKNSPEGPRTLWGAGPFGDQISWLKDDLERANADRKNHPWIVVVAHRPLYSSETEDFPLQARKNWRDAVEDIIFQNNVDFYMSGHVHAYERLYPIYNSEVDPNLYNNPRAVTPIVIGNGGNVEGHNTFLVNKPDYEPYRNNQDYGYGILSFNDESNLQFEMHRATDNSIADSFTLFRQH